MSPLAIVIWCNVGWLTRPCPHSETCCIWAEWGTPGCWARGCGVGGGIGCCKGWCNVDMVVMVVVPDWLGIGAGAMAGCVCIVAATACCCCCCGRKHKSQQSVHCASRTHWLAHSTAWRQITLIARHFNVRTTTDMFVSCPRTVMTKLRPADQMRPA